MQKHSRHVTRGRDAKLWTARVLAETGQHGPRAPSNALLVPSDSHRPPSNPTRHPSPTQLEV
eukprot:9482980-Pyramimonas_sp.AAC.1